MELLESREECAVACKAKFGCTHFVFKSLRRECLKKRGPVVKKDAFLIRTSGSFCGVLTDFDTSKMCFCEWNFILLVYFILKFLKILKSKKSRLSYVESSSIF